MYREMQQMEICCICQGCKTAKAAKQPCSLSACTVQSTDMQCVVQGGGEDYDGPAWPVD
jgi:hypothetical protein